MLDTKMLRANFQEIKAKLVHKGEDLTDFDKFEALDDRRRELIGKVEELKGKR
ncbi:serine--tRNA ligase, partial [Bacillus inaquosorum]|nr:serine--tRNA ligase [Bacillus inaquosorum]